MANPIYYDGSKDPKYQTKQSEKEVIIKPNKEYKQNKSSLSYPYPVHF